MRPSYHRPVSILPDNRLASRAAGRAGQAVARGATDGPVAVRLPALDAVAPIDVAEAFRDLPGLALLESARPGRTGRWSYLTADPVATIEVAEAGPDPFAGARGLLRRMPQDTDARRRTAGGSPPFTGGLVGFLGYDLGRRLAGMPSIAIADQDLPEMRLALHDWVIAWDRRAGVAWLAARPVDGDGLSMARRLREVTSRLDGRSPAERTPGRGGGAPAAMLVRSRTTRAGWVDQVHAVRAAIERGEIYQANLARRLEAPFDGDPWPLFGRLRTGDPALFAGFLDLGRSRDGNPRAILSASPELFLAVDASGRARADPIKGTRPRGRSREADRALLCQLLASGKDQAENVMVVDVLRNDLGRVCEPGSVRVPRLLRPERSATVQHLVTTVTGRLRPDADALSLLAAAFPGGSITGAPKIRAMEVIETLEPVRRGPYCGAMLWLGPDGRMGSSVLIRTFVADGARLSLHVGGGVTWRSDPQAEWEETVAKARGPLNAIGAAEVDR